MPSRAAPSAAPASAPTARSIVRPVTSAIVWPQKPERAPPPTSSGVTGARARLREHVDPVGEGERDALEHGIDQRVGAMGGGQAGEHARRLGIVVRRALAAEIGQEDRRGGDRSPANARKPRPRRRRRRFPRRAPSTPAIQDSAEAADSITDMPCQRPGSAWQNACSVRSGRLT